MKFYDQSNFKGELLGSPLWSQILDLDGFYRVVTKLPIHFCFLLEKSLQKRFQNLIFSQKQPKVFELIFLKRKNNFNHGKVLKNDFENKLWSLKRTFLRREAPQKSPFQNSIKHFSFHFLSTFSWLTLQDQGSFTGRCASISPVDGTLVQKG